MWNGSNSLKPSWMGRTICDLATTTVKLCHPFSTTKLLKSVILCHHSAIHWSSTMSFIFHAFTMLWKRLKHWNATLRKSSSSVYIFLGISWVLASFPNLKKDFMLTTAQWRKSLTTVTLNSRMRKQLTRNFKSQVKNYVKHKERKYTYFSVSRYSYFWKEKKERKNYLT